jgi:hypothetical protein
MLQHVFLSGAFFYLGAAVDDAAGGTDVLACLPSNLMMMIPVTVSQGRYGDEKAQQ